MLQKYSKIAYMANKTPSSYKRYQPEPGKHYEPRDFTDNWLRFYREERGMTLEQLSEFAGISKVFLTNIEREHKGPSFKTARRLAARLGVQVDELFPDEDFPTPKDMIRERLEEEGRST